MLNKFTEFNLELLFALTFITHSLISCTHIPMNYQKKAKQVTQHTEAVSWGYEAENGPDVWAQLSPEYILCAEGRCQSPIDLVNPTPTKLPPIPYDYRPTSMNVRNTGHTIEVSCPEGNWIEVDGTRYQLLQFHFHAPSEHTVVGKPFDIEGHFVHKSEDGTLAVVGLLIESGHHNFVFDPIWSHLPIVPGETQRIENVTEDGSLIVDPRFMFSPNDQITDEAPSRFWNYYRYDGSLTTPPCSEGVKWIVLTTPIEMSETQIAAFKAIIHDNNRPVQPLNERKLLVNSTEDEYLTPKPEILRENGALERSDVTRIERELHPRTEGDLPEHNNRKNREK